MGFSKLFSWVLGNRLFIGVVATVVVLLACEYAREQDSDSQSAAQTTAQAAASNDTDSVNALFDPANERTAGKYKMPANLSKGEIKQFAADAACAQEYCELWNAIVRDYGHTYDQLNDSHETVLNRIASGKGFKNTLLPARWHQIIASGQNTDEAIMLGQSYDFLRLRFAAVNFHIIGGDCSMGDVAYVKWISGHAFARISAIGPLMESANELQGWMEKEDFDPPYYSAVNALTTHPDLQQYMNEIYAKYHQSTEIPPKLLSPR